MAAPTSTPAPIREPQAGIAMADNGAMPRAASESATSAEDQATRAAGSVPADTAQGTVARQSRGAEAVIVPETVKVVEEVSSAPAPATAEATPAVAVANPARALAPWDDAPADPASIEASASARLNDAIANEVPATNAVPNEAASNEAPDAPRLGDAAPASALTAPATAALARTEQAAAARQGPSELAPATEAAPRRAGGASAALDVLRSAGLKVSSDRGRATAAAAAKPAAPATPKPAAPRVVVPVPTPGAPRRAPQEAAPAARAPSPSSPAPRNGAEQGNSAMPPWDDMPPDDYVPISASDDGYFGPPDDDYMPVFDRGPDDVRVNAPAAAAPVPAVDARPLPPAVPLDPLGFNGDWPALAVDLPLKGISYQLAFNSELMALDGNTLKLNVPVPQYAEASQVAKLKTALAERLGRQVEVLVEVGAARRTAAAHDAAMRAQRQQQAEREIGADPFVQSLIREFGASIVPGSIRPITPDAAPNGASSVH
jgi:DNA polymerase-3 subunit gamma/tau